MNRNRGKKLMLLRRLIISVGILLAIMVVGCSSKDKEMDEKTTSLQEMINMEFGNNVYLPQYDEFEINGAYVSYEFDGEARQVAITYSPKGELKEYYGDKEDFKQFARETDLNFLYGPHEGDISVMFFYKERVAPFGDETMGTRIIFEGIEVDIQEGRDPNNYQNHAFVYNGNHYSFGYQMDTMFTDEEAIKQTHTYIKGLIETVIIDEDIAIEESAFDSKDALIKFKDDEDHIVATDLDLVPGSARLADIGDGDSVGVTVTFKDAAKLASITEDNIGKPLHIYFGDQLIASPRVQARLTDGRVVITGSTEETAKKMMEVINR